jgi:hypothetical protein
MSAAGERIFVKKIKREKSESAEAHVIADLIDLNNLADEFTGHR